MKRIVFTLIVVILILCLTSSGYAAEEKLEWNENWPKKIRIASGAIGAGMYMGASAMAAALKEEFPHLELIVEQTKAAGHNIRLIESGEAEFGLCTSDILPDAWTGKGYFEGQELKGFRALLPAYGAGMTFVTLKKNNITNIKQITGRVTAGGLHSASDIFARKSIEAFDLDVDYSNVPTSDATTLLTNGMITAYITGYPNTTTQDLSMQVELRVIGISGEDAEYFLNLHPEYAYPFTIPAGYYKGQDESSEVVGFHVLYITRDDLPEDMIYTVLKAMYKNIDVVEDTWPQTSDMMKTDSIKLVSSPLHKGSIKYYREIGLELQERAILDE